MPVETTPVLHCTGNTFVLLAELEGGRVLRAESGGRMLRDPGALLRTGMDSRGAPEFMEQAHCLCGSAHALGAVRALEDLAGTVPPRAALLARDLAVAVRGMRDDLIHVYQFYLSDWMAQDHALAADPARAARLADAPGEDAAFFARAKEVLRALPALPGDLTADHPARQGSPEVHILVRAHALGALAVAADLGAALALLEGGGDGRPFLRVGGLPEGLDLGPATRRTVLEAAIRCDAFTRNTLLPDLARMARTYPDQTREGRGGAHLCWGDLLHPSGRGDLFPAAACLLPGPDGGTAVRTARPDRVRELEGAVHGPQPGLPDFRWPEGDFRPLPAPRLDGRSWEMGPSARLLAAGAGGDETVLGVLGEFRDATGLPPEALDSTLGRSLARGLECAVLARCVPAWIEALAACADDGDRGGPWSLPSSGRGTGRVEVARGGLLHTIRVEDGRIRDHSCLVPSLWNFSPRDANGTPGPLERALEGLAVADPARPVEILRTVHSFAPCNACVVLVRDRETQTTHTVDTQ